ncbi:MAG: hypothetical protein FWC79_04960 [Oscillospiraceae bacterium]|nr:hypothetical protein [Oscillospiraceae bacterium]
MNKQKSTGENHVLKKINIPISLIMAITMVSIFLVSVAFSALNEDLTISGDAVFRTEADVRITGLRLVSGTNGGMEDYNSQFAVAGIITGVTLPDLESTVTYEITVTNFTYQPFVLEEILRTNFNNENMTYTLTGIEMVEDRIGGFETITFQITFRYRSDIATLPEEQSLGSRLELVFGIPQTTPVIVVADNIPNFFFMGQANNFDFTSYVTADDETDGNLTDSVTVSVSPGLNAGRRTVTFNVTNSQGNSAEPVTVNIEVWNFVQIVSGQNNTALLSSDGRVWTFGANDMAQRGQGTSGTSNSVALRVPTQIPQSFFEDLPVTQLASGQNTIFAINSNGHAFAWGNRASGRPGTSAPTTAGVLNRPTRVAGTMTFTQVDSQWAATGAIGIDGNVWTWGSQSDTGALGQGNTTADRAAPVQITTSGNFVYIAMGRFGGAAVTNEGHVYVWGSNLRGQLGDGTTHAETAANRFTPRRVPNLENIVKVDYGERHILALSADGYVYGWGTGALGRLGNGMTGAEGAATNVTVPTRIPGISGASDINTRKFILAN